MVFVENYLKTNDAKGSALVAGYSPICAAKVAHNLLKMPCVKAIVDNARNAVAKRGEYNLERLMDELNDGAAFARETGNATALARFTELKAKAMGLLIERIDQRQVGSFEINITGIDKPKAPEPIDITPSETSDIFK
jgi:phage terminase small subunit